MPIFSVFHSKCQIMYRWISKKREYWTKGNILGQFGWQMSDQPMIFPFVQYSLIFNIHLYMIWHIQTYTIMAGFYENWIKDAWNLKVCHTMWNFITYYWGTKSYYWEIRAIRRRTMRGPLYLVLCKYYIVKKAL